MVPTLGFKVLLRSIQLGLGEFQVGGPNCKFCIQDCIYTTSGRSWDQDSGASSSGSEVTGQSSAHLNVTW